MARQGLIAPRRGSTPSAPRSSPATRHALPADLLREASRRLSVVSLLGGGLWLGGWTISHLIGTPLTHQHKKHVLLVPDVVVAGVVLVSLALFFYVRRSQRDPRFIINLGLGYMLLLSFAMGQMFHWKPLHGMSVSPMISWIGVMLLLFAAVLPATPGRTLIASLFAASMNPVGMLIAKARGNWDFGPNINILIMHYPDYLLVGVAVTISHIFTRLGEQVSRARELGSYQLGELLGSGGMGEVYRATHRMLARPAAIKLIRSELIAAGSGDAAQLAVKRFRREAEVAASLRSPHTVALYDFGVTEDQRLYLVMELLDGVDLEALVREHGPLPPNRTIHLLQQVCASLEEAHARGLVHRDIKPANIHVGRLGLKHDFVKVLDFGLVKRADATVQGQTLRTGADQVPGTPAYMPPEMALDRKVDGRADLYALGCTAYYALTGKLVFEGTSSFHVLARHIHDEPNPVSDRAPSPIPEALDALILACLSKEPEARPPTAAALAEALARIEIEPWTEEQARSWWNEHPPVARVSSSETASIFASSSALFDTERA